MRQAKNCDSMTSTFMNYSTGRRFYETFTEIQEKGSFLRVTKFRTEIFDKYSEDDIATFKDDIF